MKANNECSVVIVSIVWVIVLSRLEQTDVTCNCPHIWLFPHTTDRLNNHRELRQRRHLVRARTQHGRHLRLYP